MPPFNPGRLTPIIIRPIITGSSTPAQRCCAWMMAQVYRLTWLTLLPNCPCSIGVPPANPNPSDWRNPSPADPAYHPGASFCMRSVPTPQGHGQQCCYDNAGLLITDGGGAGTPDWCAPEGSGIVCHITDDVFPYNDCAAAGCPQNYLNGRPPNNGNNCLQNGVPYSQSCACN